MKSLPEVISRRNYIDTSPITDSKRQWLCMKPCPDCRKRLTTDGQYFWCVSCGYDNRPEEIVDVYPKTIRWTDKEEKWLANNWSKLSVMEIEKHLHRSLATCRQKVYNLRARGYRIDDRLRKNINKRGKK